MYQAVWLADELCPFGDHNCSKCVQGGSPRAALRVPANNKGGDTVRCTTGKTNNTIADNVVNIFETHQGISLSSML